MIRELRIHALRNLSQVSLAPSECNLIVGQNGSGKTSLLEAVFLLSRGKSFRHHEPKRYIQHHAKSCTIWAKTNNKTLAIQKNLDAKSLATTLLKIDDITAASQSAMSFLLPTLLIDPTGMALLEEGSGSRRQMLDWLVFHMEQQFYPKWLSYQRLLKQRNAALKSAHIHASEITAWDSALSACADVLHDCRWRIFDKWQGFFDEMITKLLPSYHGRITLSYQAGFDVQSGLLPILKSRILQDKELGYTRMGAHRADVMVGFYQVGDMGEKLKEQAANVLSRGEKKLLITALKLSQLQMICQYSPDINPVVLLDDIDAELDDKAVDVMLDVLLALPCQLFITSLQEKTSDKICQKFNDLGRNLEKFKVFHVEQGMVAQMNMESA